MENQGKIILYFYNKLFLKLSCLFVIEFMVASPVFKINRTV